MSFVLYVDGDRWRAQLRAVTAAHVGIVPVIKGNGYGFGSGRLARRAGWLGADTIAVGTYEDVPEVLSRFGGDVLVLSPWRPFLRNVPYDHRVIHTVGRVADIEALKATAPAGTAVVIEGQTSMARHGFDRHSLARAKQALGQFAARSQLAVRGFAIHLPIAGDNLSEAQEWAAVLEASHLETTTLFVSHLTTTEYAALRRDRPALTIRPRIGTALWHGDLSAIQARSTVLDVHEVSRGERVGYRQRAMPRDGNLVIVSGGTSHGIGMEGPRAASNVVQRGKAFAKGSLEAAGLTLSPFTIAGKQRWFAEPPHMQASMLFLPASVPPPAVGDEVDAAVRFTTVLFDEVVFD